MDDWRDKFYDQPSDFDEDPEDSEDSEDLGNSREEIDFEESSGDRSRFWEKTWGKRLEGIVPEAIKRTIAGTLGSIFLSDEKFKQSLVDLKLPKELIQYLLHQADHTKKEILKLVAKEIRDFLESTNFYDELFRILTTLSFEIKTEIRLIPNDKAIVPNVKNQFKVKTQAQDSEKGDDHSES